MSRLPDMAERCRICLLDYGCMTSLHDERVEAKLKDLTKCTSIDIKHVENLPSIVCHVCLYKLDMWSEFKEQFIESNKILLGQLGVSEVLDNRIRDISTDERHPVEGIKRKLLNASGEESISDHDKKKYKTETASSEHANVECVTGQILLDTIYISDDDDESIMPKDTSQEALNVSDSGKKENGSEEHTEKSSMNLKARLLSGRRGRAIERRKASTKRWVERKKALMAAVGDNVSDTDSVGSDDDTQLSPVQKARAKTIADKEAERQKRIAKVLKNLETNLTEKYIADFSIGDTDSDTRRTRLSKELHPKTMRDSNKNSLLKQQTAKHDSVRVERDRSSSQEKSVEKKDSSVTSNTDYTKKSTSLADNETFTPHMMKSELMVGNVKYIVTSTLILTSPHNDKEGLNNNLTKDCKSLNMDENGQEKNTDIIDAVQLRRINPIVPSSNNSKKYIERCLNIEVEGTEVETLKRVQTELADFVENEMKHKLFGTNGSTARIDKMENACEKSYRKLDQRLKIMIERTIKNNIESSLMRDAADMSVPTCDSTVTKVSSAFVKTAVNSPRYQPKVMVKRLDITKASKLYKINNIHALKQNVPKNKLAGPFSAISRKRQSVPPKRYSDYNTSALDSDDTEESDNTTQETSKVANTSNINTSNIRTYGNLAVRQSPGAHSQIAIIKRVDGSTIKTAVNSIGSVSLVSVGQNSTLTGEQKPDYEDAIKIEGAIAENHICGVCGLTFSSRKDVEAHVRTHKITSTENNTVAPRQNQKQKVMRCKRCQEIVDARYVRTHVCKTVVVHAHKCYVCNSTFRTEKLLVRHLESHDQSEFTIESITKIESKNPSNNDSALQRTKLNVSAKPEDQVQKNETSKMQGIFTEKNSVQSEKITSTGAELDFANIVEKSKETYTCFVCDKIFTDEEILKDHLQKHCDDLSEGEQSNSKEQYQCAICGDTLDSDSALEEHVGKHLFDDEDDNPNLISIDDQESEKPKTATYLCGQCSQTFDSEVSLEMHVQAHEEEAAIAELEKKGMDVYPYQCMLCGEHIDTEEELNKHLDVVHNILTCYNIHSEDAQICQLCEKSFSTLEDLQKHVAIH